MTYVAYAVLPGTSVRILCRRESPVAALQYARSHLRPGESPSVNREDVPAPSIRASETFAGIGNPMTKEEAVKKMCSWQAVNLAAARAARKAKRRGY